MASEASSDGRSLQTLYWLGGYGYWIMASWAILAPFLARDFGLDDARITFLGGVVSLGSFGTVLLTRLADRRGRRRVLLVSFAGLPLAAALTALAPGELSFALAQIAASALNGAMMALVTVIIAEESVEHGRAEGQAWFGLAGTLGGALPLLLVLLLEDFPAGWRAAWAAAALPVLALPLVRRSIRETKRFERAEARGRVSATRGRDLFRGVYRRRAIGLLVAGTLRPVAINASFTWIIYHMVQNLHLGGGTTLAVLGIGGGLGVLGIPVGARLSNGWGRRPTSAAFAALTVLAAVAFYWVPPDFPPHPALGLGLAFFVAHFALQAFSVADRCLETELFPTALRSTYGGWTRIALAAATAGAHFAVSGLTLLLGDFVLAITVLSLVCIALALAVFLAVCPETRGLSLDAAALEDLPACD